MFSIKNYTLTLLYSIKSETHFKKIIYVQLNNNNVICKLLLYSCVITLDVNSNNKFANVYILV